MKKIITQNQTVMNKYTREELLEQLPVGIRETKELYPNPKVVLGQLMIYDGLEKKDKDGYFFRSNLDLKDDCSIKEEKTVIAAVRKLASMGFINTVRGSRKGASLYRINKKTIDDYCKSQVGDYCKKEIEDYSNNYSKQIAEMTSRIKELENTVKMLVDKITVIEGKDYSTDKEIDIDKDIEKIIYNILNNNISKNTLIEKLNIILEESKKDKELEKEDTNGGKELEAEESEKELDRYQPVETESQASSPTEELSQASSSDVSTVAEPLEEETYIPTEDEQYQLWLEAMTPYLNEIEESVTLGQMKDIRARLSQYAADFLDSHENTSQTVLDRIDKLVISTYNTKLNYLKNPSPNPIELFQYQSRQLN